MGRRGPRPKPTALRTLEGDPGKLLRKRRQEPRPAKAVGMACPDWIHGAARLEWRRIVPELERLSLLTVIDVAVLEAHCVTYGNWRAAVRAKKHERTTRLGAELRKFAAEFGLSPAARVRLHVDDATPPPRLPKPTGDGRAADAGGEPARSNVRPIGRFFPDGGH